MMVNWKDKDKLKVKKRARWTLQKLTICAFSILILASVTFELYDVCSLIDSVQLLPPDST